MQTLADLARQWHAEVERSNGAEGVGDLLAIDRAVIEAPVVTREDAIALLGVCIADFRTQHDVETLSDPDLELVWKAINAAYLMLKVV